MKSLDELLKVELNEKKPCLMKADVTIPATVVKDEINTTVKEFSKYAQLPGFRVGKVPKHLIKKRFDSDIKAEVTRKFQAAAFEKIKEMSPTDIVTIPISEKDLPEPDSEKEFSFSLLVNVAPEIKLPKYTGIKLKKPDVKVDKKEVDAEVDRMRDMYAEFTTVNEAAQEGDMLKISYTSNLEADKEATAGYKRYVSVKDAWCWLSEPEMLPGIIEALKGTKAGAEKKMKVVFPEGFMEASLVGKETEYDIKVTEVQRRIPLKSDEELCKRINVPDMKTFREQIEQSLEFRAQMDANNKMRQTALDTVCKSVEKLDLPPDVLAQATQMEFRNIANNLVKSEEDAENFKKESEKHRKNAEEIAKKRLFVYFICKRIADEENITVEQEDIDNQIATISRTYGYRKEELRKQMESSGGFEQLHMDLLVAKVNDLIIDKADIAESAQQTDKK